MLHVNGNTYVEAESYGRAETRFLKELGSGYVEAGAYGSAETRLFKEN